MGPGSVRRFSHSPPENGPSRFVLPTIDNHRCAPLALALPKTVHSAQAERYKISCRLCEPPRAAFTLR